MGFFSWILLGLFAGSIAQMLVPGRSEPSGCIGTTAVGILGALLGGWLATELDLGDGDYDQFFDLSTWLMAIGGSAVLLVIFRAIAR